MTDLTITLELSVQETDVLIDALVHRRVGLDTFRFTATINGATNAEKMVALVQAVEWKVMRAALLAGANHKDAS